MEREPATATRGRKTSCWASGVMTVVLHGTCHAPAPDLCARPLQRAHELRAATAPRCRSISGQGSVDEIGARALAALQA